MKNQIRRFLKEELAKIRKLSFREAVEYIWQYFGLFIVLFIGAVWLLVSFISGLISGPPQYWVYGSFANTLSNASNNSRMWRDFAAFSGFDTEEKRIEFSTNMYFDYSRDQGRGNEYYNTFVTLADTGTLDFITMYPNQLAPLGQSGRLLDWNTERCDALREKYSDRLIYYEPPEGAEQTEPVPVGIDISDSLLVTKYGIYTDSCALGISAQSERLDAVAVFLEFILGEE